MTGDAVTRRGELSAASLHDAMLDERERGRRPVQLAVGCLELEVVAVRLLEDAGPLGALRAGVANVVIDEGLGEREWELRES